MEIQNFIIESFETNRVFHFSKEQIEVIDEEHGILFEKSGDFYLLKFDENNLSKLFNNAKKFRKRNESILVERENDKYKKHLVIGSVN